MPDMKTFSETDHPRGQTRNSGQWRDKEHSIPETRLSDRNTVEDNAPEWFTRITPEDIAEMATSR